METTDENFCHRAMRLAAALLFIYCTATPALADAPADCPSCDTLNKLVDFVKDRMPEEDSSLYSAPDAQTLVDWRQTISQIMAGQCETLVLPTTLSNHYTVLAFTDAADGRDYCVLYETGDNDVNGVIDRGWGTFVFSGAGDAKNLSIDVPHPLHDSDTPAQGIAIFKGTNARTFAMAGAHRNAIDAPSPCINNPDYKLADATHNAQHTFQATTQALNAHYAAEGQEYTALQFHGMGESTCADVDVYITHGTDQTPADGALIDQLKENFSAAIPAPWNWLVAVPGDAPGCNLNGISNVQGRLLNGVTEDSVCQIQAAGYSGHFVHIEQKKAARNDSVYAHWIAAINALDFDSVPAPASLHVTSPNGAETWDLGAQASIAWDSESIDGLVHIALFKGDDYRKTIHHGTANDGEYSWIVPDYLAEASDYRVRVRSVEDTQLKDYSDAFFTIEHGASTPSLLVTLPNGGEVWEKSQQQIVTWNSTAIAGQVKISLHKNGSYYKTIANSAPNTGFYAWVVPSYVAAGDAYTVRVRSVDDTSIKDFSDQNFSVLEAAQPLLTADSYPNPFNPETTIRFSLPVAEQVKVQVYDALGQRVATLVDGYRSAGTHHVRFAASHLGSGYYFFRIETSDQALVRRMLLLK
jgi:hypothetical protein